MVHPHRGNSLTSLRSRIATIIAADYGIATPGVKLTGYNETIIGPGLHRVVEPKGDVLTGLDVLAAENFAPLRGKRIGLITNQTGLSRDGKRNVDLMLAAGIKITAVFSPEHGLLGNQDQPNISNSKDPATGLPVFSLYQGPSRRIAPQMLDGIDALVFDIQDVGARFYTYSCTMLYSMQEAAKKHAAIFRAGPPQPDHRRPRRRSCCSIADLESFTGCFEIPVRHGMTLGELANMANAEQNLGLDLHVIAMKGWDRGDWFDSTGLTWVNPSPNMRSLNAALLYPGIALLEASPELLGRPRHRCAFRTDRRRLDPRPRNSPRFLNGRYIPGRARLSDSLSTSLLQFRRTHD